MKLPLRLLLLAAAASALCGGAAHAQGGAFCLRTIDPFASNNAGPPDGAVYFDLVVRAPVSITGLLMNYGTAAGLPVGVEVYTTPGTSIGNETRAAAWTLAAPDWGGGASPTDRSRS